MRLENRLGGAAVAEIGAAGVLELVAPEVTAEVTVIVKDQKLALRSEGVAEDVGCRQPRAPTTTRP
jgi:hypothetical protein